MKVRLPPFARRFVCLALVSHLAASCAGSTDVQVGSGGHSGTGSGGNTGTGGTVSCAAGGSSGTSALATWDNVKDVVSGGNPGGCYGSDCHIQGDRQPYLLALAAAPLSDADLYNKLTTYKTMKCGQRLLVKPCAPEESAFYLAQAGRCSDLPQMPFGCNPVYQNCTPDDKLEGVRQWILKGAPRP